MKIMLVTPYFAPKIGGLESYALAIAKGLHEKYNHDVFVVTSNHANKKRTEDIIDGIRVIRLPILFKLSNTPINPQWYRHIKEIIKQEKPDIINAHSPVPCMADLAIAASPKELPVVLTYHAGSMLKGGGLVDVILGLYEKHILNKVFNRANKIIAINPKFIEKYIQDTSKIIFIPPGIDTAIFHPDPTTQKSSDILFVGRIEKSSSWKGISTLLDATAIIKRDSPGIRLRIVGTGDAIDMYRQKAQELDIEQNVEFAGSLQGEKLVDAYNQSKMLILPSETEAESFGMVLTEAMSCGIPTVGSNIGGIPNVIVDKKTGILTEPKNAVSLASAISTLLTNNELCTSYGAAGRERVLANFSREQQLAKTDELFRSLHA